MNCKVFFPRKKQLDEHVCPEHVHFYSRGWILDEQKVWWLPSQLLMITSICYLSLETGDIAGHDLEPCQKTTGSRDEKARVLCAPGAFTHNTYAVGSKVTRVLVQSTAWVCMGENGTEAKAEGEIQAVVIVRLNWNLPLIPPQEEKNENGFELTGKAWDEAAREVL